ncbi:MAG: nuclear transport factor 2 family protein, partial [Candidatus Rokuibacteriota bacterium]
PFSPRVGTEDEIRNVLEQFKRAFESKDLVMVQRLRPGMRPEDLRSLGETFRNARSYRLDLRVETLKIAGDEAQARTLKRDVMTANDGQIHQSETTVTVVLRRQGGSWTISDIK